jgi:hypothetical protein
MSREEKDNESSFKVCKVLLFISDGYAAIGYGRDECEI